MQASASMLSSRNISWYVERQVYSCLPFETLGALLLVSKTARRVLQLFLAQATQLIISLNRIAEVFPVYNRIARAACIQFSRNNLRHLEIREEDYMNKAPGWLRPWLGRLVFQNKDSLWRVTCTTHILDIAEMLICCNNLREIKFKDWRVVRDKFESLRTLVARCRDLEVLSIASSDTVLLQQLVTAAGYLRVYCFEMLEIINLLCCVPVYSWSQTRSTTLESVLRDFSIVCDATGILSYGFAAR